MPKHLAALLSILGLAGSAAPAAKAQVLKGTQPASKTAESTVKLDKAKREGHAAAQDAPIKEGKNAAEAGKVRSDAAVKMRKGENQGVLIGLDQPGAQKNKLDLKQSNLRKATPRASTSKSANQDPTTIGTAHMTKGNAQVTRGNQQITKGNQQITKGNQQITKGNQPIAK
jgi:hypothetical protein